MPATQLSNSSQSHGLTNRRSNSIQIKENYGSSLSLHRGEAFNFVACSGRKTNFENGCSLSARHRKFLAPLVKHHRKPRFSLVGKHLSSDFDVGTSEFEGENGIGSSGNDPSSSFHTIKFSKCQTRALALSIPAIAGQAIDPLAQLMETAYIGRLGSMELGSAGVSVNIFNYISKLFNIPLLSIATSFVAEDISKYETKASATEKSILEGSTNGKPSDGAAERKQLPSVSTALTLAIGIGVFEALALSLGSGLFLSLMGISMDSPMRIPAKQLLSLRALGAPAVVVSLSLQGVYQLRHLLMKK